MPGADPPAGWYPDPAGSPEPSEATPERLRWWDGQAWTAQTREAGPAGVAPARRPKATHWPRERTIAAGAVGGLVLISLAIWLIAVVLGGDAPPIAIDDVDELPSDGAEDGAGDEADDNPTGDGATDDVADDGAAGDDDATGTPSEDGAPDAESGRTGNDTPETIEFDGACEVEVDDDVDVDDLRPWHFAECEHAPIDPGRTGGRWIVVVASLNGDEVAESDAVDRSARSDHGLLWSSHYPSLNPNLWVLFEGPFADEEAANEAAERIGGGSYPRVLSQDEADRYCIAADGCVGGTG